jgi:hypothetical protein
MKMGLPPRIGVTRNYWNNYAIQCNQNPNAVKKSYANMVFLNITPAHTPVNVGFHQSPNGFYGSSCSNLRGITRYESRQLAGKHFQQHTT